MVRKYNPYCKHEEYGDGMEGAMMESRFGEFVKLETYNDETARLRAVMERQQDSAYKCFLACLKRVGIGDGTPGYIQHDVNGEFIKDPLSLEGEMYFAFEAIAAYIEDLKSKIPSAESNVPVCAGCGSRENLHEDLGSGGPYRCGSLYCISF